MAEYIGESTTDDDSSQVGLSTIFTTLDDLEKAKTNLQNEYEALLAEHKCGEEKMEEIRTKLSEASHGYVKRQADINEKQLKVDTVIGRARHMEGRCHELRDKVSSLQAELEKEKQKQILSLENFEAQMTDLKDLFLKAVSFYKENELESEIAKTKEQTKTFQGQGVESQVEQVKQELSTLSLLPIETDPWEEKLPMEQRNCLLDLFSKERAALQAEVDRLKEMREKTHSELKPLESGSSIPELNEK